MAKEQTETKAQIPVADLMGCTCAVCSATMKHTPAVVASLVSVREANLGEWVLWDALEILLKRHTTWRVRDNPRTQRRECVCFSCWEEACFPERLPGYRRFKGCDCCGAWWWKVGKKVVVEYLRKGDDNGGYERRPVMQKECLVCGHGWVEELKKKWKPPAPIKVEPEKKPMVG